ncbi:MAG: AAA family ATPase [Candidatus Diapherotrites archaeon]|nr:AAA family ATPase [Candidatus Diapherotrites archaeon]
MSDNLFAREFFKETVFSDRNLMTPHYTPPILPFREKEIGLLSKNLSLCLRAQKADNFFLYGKTGTGKTAVTRHVLAQLNAFATQKGLLAAGYYINCRQHNSKYQILSKLIKEFFPAENFMGYSASFVYEKVLDFAKKGNQSIIVLDEIDKVKDVDELVYALTRGNDELVNGGLTLIGISNNLTFKDRLDPRTKSSLCEQEVVFPPYNAAELKKILQERTLVAFKPLVVEESAINLASALAAQESGDARTAILLLLRAGDLAEKNNSFKVTDQEVLAAKVRVEEEIILDMISSLPRQQQLVLLAIAELSLQSKGVRRLGLEEETKVLFSGEVYEHYCWKAKELKETLISSRWFRQYISELEMFGLIHTTLSGKGIRGQTRLIKLGFDASKIRNQIEKQLQAA